MQGGKKGVREREREREREEREKARQRKSERRSEEQRVCMADIKGTQGNIQRE